MPNARPPSKVHDPGVRMPEKIVRHRHSGIRVSLEPVVMDVSGIAQLCLFSLYTTFKADKLFWFL
jgi:hypothetical protein